MINRSTTRSPERLQVTASTLVRHFGEWQERAARAPVYVLHHGRPRLVLLGVDLLAGMAAPAAEARPEPLLAPLLDAIDLPLVLLGDRGAIEHANSAARARFGEQVAPGATVAELSRRDGGTLVAAVHRVLAGAERERVALVPDRFPGRALEVMVEPLPRGCLLRVEDATARAEARATTAERDAIIAALEGAGNVAVARVSLRGTLLAPRAALAALVGRTTEELANERFLALIARADRPAVGDSLERASGGIGNAVDAALATGNGEPLDVGLSFWPIRVAGRVEEVAVALVRRTL